MKPIWYRENDYYAFHREKGNQINKCHHFQNVIQDLIEMGDLVINNPLVPHNKNANIYKDPLPRQNQVDANQVNYVNNFSLQNFVGMIHVVTRNQKNIPPRQDTSSSNQDPRNNDSRGTQGSRGPSHNQNQRCTIITIKSNITHQLKSLQTKMSIFGILQTSKAHRDALMEVLKSI